MTSDFYVYLHRKKSDNSVFYVGKGCGRRAWRSDRASGRSKYWRRISSKYGYTVELYAMGIQEWYAFELETMLIAYYGRENLCNLTDGGEGGAGIAVKEETKMLFREMYSGVKRSPETLEKMSKALKGKKLSDEHKRKISKAHKGKVFSDDVRRKISEAKKAYEFTPEHRAKIGLAHRKSVVCSNGLRFDGMRLAVDWLKSIGFEKAAVSRISSVCRVGRGTAYGFNWRFESA